MKDNRLFLLDAYALIFRSYYAFIKNPRITTYGLNTSAIFGFTNTLLDVIEKQKPTHIAVVFDHKSPTFREQEHDFYKANRDETPEDIKRSEPFIRKIIEAFHIPILESPGYEADDVIGTLANKAVDEGFITYMMTSDKDFGQLVTDKIKVYRPSRQGNGVEIWGPEEVREKFVLDEPAQVIDYLGLMGDSVDNIPGVPGVGPKTASALIKEYGSMEAIYQNLDKLKGKLKENLENFKEQAFISKKLATILIDAPVPFDVKDLNLDDPDKDKLKEIFAELEFRTLGQRLLGQDPALLPKGGQQSLFDDMPATTATIGIVHAQESTLNTIENTPHDYVLVNTDEDRKKLLKEILQQKSVSFDTETTGLDPMDAEILGFSISWEKGTGYYVPVEKGKGNEVLEVFKPFFENESIEKIFQNEKYDLRILWKYGVDIRGPVFDTMLAHYLIEPDQRHNMDALAEKYLSYRPISITDLIGKKGKNQLTFDVVDLEKAAEYASEDADVTYQLKQKLAPQLEGRVRDIFEQMEIPLVPVLAKMENQGVKVDADFLNKYSMELEEELNAIIKEIYSLADGIQFNIASPKQLGEVLFDHLKLDSKAKKTRTGQYKTDEETLQKLADRHPLPRFILEYRQIQKLRSTYVDALPLLINEKTGRVHTSFGQAVAATGRLSSNNPNLQNIPIRTDKGREIRKAFIPRDNDHVLLAADYSQIELRIIASVAEDKAMMEAFMAGHDIHRATASKVFNVDLENVTSEMRRQAKTVNFGIIYGISAFGLSQRAGMSRTEAKEIIDAYFEQFSGIKRYMDDTIRFCRENGFVETIMGRRRYIRDINSKNRTVAGFAERNAINAPIQGAAADMIKMAMISIDNELSKSSLKSKMILQVHDELLFDVPRNEVEELRAMIIPLMENAMPLKVPVIVESGTGENWLEAH